MVKNLYSFPVTMQFDQDYYPGRRKRGKDYNEEMVLFVIYLLFNISYSDYMEVVISQLFNFFIFVLCSLNFHLYILDRFVNCN